MDNPQNPTTHEFDQAPPIAIVGGGLCGLALAIGLLKNGVRNIRIYEAAPEFSEIGAGVAFGPNSTKALQLIDPLLLQGYKKHATFNEDRERDDTFMSFRWGMDESKEGGKRAGDFMWHLEDKWNPAATRNLGVRTRSCIHRARLLEEMVALLPDGIASFRKSFQRLEEQQDGTLKLFFADGTSAMASALIGCDGIKSQVRGNVCGMDVKPKYVGEFAFRALVPKLEAEQVLGAQLARNGQLYCGYGASIVTYPVEHGEYTNMVAIWHEPGDSWVWENEEWTVPATKEDFLSRFQGWYAPLVQLFGRHLQPWKWALFDMQHAVSYNKGRICLLGDSAHATTPHLGAGAGMAMEDAHILSQLVASVRDVSKIEDAFRAFDTIRRPRTQQLIKNSRAAGLGLEFSLPGVVDDAAASKEHFEAWYKWLWADTWATELQAAKSLL